MALGSALLVVQVAASVEQSRLQAAADRTGTARAAFPIRVSQASRHLEDSNGQPFLLHADVAGNILVQLSRSDALHYLDDRQARGFNTIVTGLIEKYFATHAPANLEGEQPFLVPGDFSTPNDAYFDHVAWFLEEAAARGMIVAMTPAWLGFDAGREGWYHEMAANGREKLRDYGRYLGRRFAGFDNIVWIHGGDYNPPDKELVRAVVEGIREYDGHSLHTVHCAPGYSALDIWDGEDWLDIDSVYTYGPVYPVVVSQYRNHRALPFILMESAFENEHGVTEAGLRHQAYQALLTGASGHIFGNNPIWHFDGPGLYDVDITWQEALDSRGAQSMTHLRAFMEDVEWWTLQPDIEGRFLVTGAGDEDERAVAAVSADRTLGVIYFPDQRSMELDLGMLNGGARSMRWFDPATGRYEEPVTIDTASGSTSFTPPGDNAAGFDDWLLVIETDDDRS